MTINELTQLVEESHEVLLTTFKSEYKRNPKEGELLNYIRELYKKNEQEDLISNLFLEDVDCPDDFIKLLLLFATKN
jgi:hypothetical protein